MPFLRQSTSQVIRFGPFVDKTDGVTAETGLTLAQGDMQLSKDGGAFAQKSAAGNATHDTAGWYSTTLSTTDTNGVGELIMQVDQDANALPVWQRWWVLEENVYDAWFGASGAAGTDLAAILTDTGVIGAAGAGLTDLGGMSTGMKGEVNAEADTALTDYDAPTKAEMDTGHALLATEAKQDIIDTVVDAIKVVTDNLPDSGALNDLAAILVDTGTTLQAELDGIQADTEDIQTQIGTAGAGLTDLGGMSTGMQAEIESEANDALVAQKLDHLVAVADGDDPVNGSIMAHIVSATEDWSTFVPSTDSLQALRDALATAAALTTVDTVVDAIKAVTDNLPNSGSLTNLDAAVSTRATPAQVNTEAKDVLDTDTHAELSGVPAIASSLRDMIRWMFTLSRNRVTQTATTQTLRDDAKAADLATAAVSDDGTTAVRDEWA